jgi:hypothetical protein
MASMSARWIFLVLSTRSRTPDRSRCGIKSIKPAGPVAAPIALGGLVICGATDGAVLPLARSDRLVESGRRAVRRAEAAPIGEH